ncbi:MAG TPA: sigma-70 family RNA polymerase sigma factor [Gemmatimonadales bacterium]|nr:sigma-70 family RNA polymerase sigma factor [Gemmatimonadales bacterium]
MVESVDGLAESARKLRAAFEAEVEPLRPALWRYCHRLTGSAWDAEDLVQETMQRALARLADLWQPVNTKAYLFRVASNAWVDRRRREVRGELVELAEDQAAVAVDPELRLEAHDAIARLVAVLTPLQRVVFLLCQTLDFTAREVAALLGTSEGAVKAALHRARAALAAAPAATPAPRASIRDLARLEPIVRRYVTAFDARDPDAIAALLHEDAVTTIVGSAEELGREASRRSSLAEWAADPVRQWARPGVVDGREVILVLAEREGAQVLYSIIELRCTTAIHAQRDYFYCPELLEHVAEALRLGAWTHGHQYPFA